MSEWKKVLESPMKVRFHDCDPFNHLNNSRYIDYIMTARGDQLMDAYGMDIYRLGREQSIGWVTALTQISYLSPARLMEEVIISTQLLSFSGKGLHFEATMWNHNKTVLHAVMWVKLVHYDLVAQRSHHHSPELMSFFGNIVNPLPASVTFEERVFGLKSAA